MILSKYYQEIINNPLNSIIIIFNIIITEILLSIDNAIIISSIIINLKKKYRQKAIKYGIIGAYLFRSICLGLTTFLVKIWWLKPLSGLYLIVIGLSFMNTEQKINHTKSSWLNINLKKILGNFWSNILTIELIDIAFSIDNVLASAAFSNNTLIILIGVFSSILMTRLISHNITKSVEKYTCIKKFGFFIIILLGTKLLLSFYHNNFIYKILNNTIFQIIFFIITIIIILMKIKRQNNQSSIK